MDDIDEAVDALTARGVRFERYDGMEQDDKGVFREEGPYIAGGRRRSFRGAATRSVMIRGKTPIDGGLLGAD